MPKFILDRAIALTIKALDRTRTRAERDELIVEALALLMLVGGNA